MEQMLTNYTDFSKALDAASSIDNMAPNAVRKAVNADFTTLGAIKVRGRIAPFISEIAKKVIPFRSNTSNINYLMAQIGTDLIRIDEQGVKTTLLSPCDLQAGITFWSPTLMKDIFIFADGTTLRKYDGTTVTTLSGTAPAGKYLALHKNRLMVSGGTAPEAVFISKIGDPEDFSEAIPIRIPTWRGDAIINIVEYMDRLYVFMQHSIHVIMGDVIEDFSTTPIINNIGCLCSSAVGTNGANIVFIGNDKRIYEFDGKDLDDISSESIKPYMDAIDNTKINEIVIYPFGATVNLLLPQTDGSKVFLVYDITRRIWTNPVISSIMNIGTRTESGVDRLLALTDNGVFDITDEQGSDGYATPTPVPLEVEFRPLGIETPAQRKKFKRLFLGLKSTEQVTVTYHTDEQPTVRTVTPFVPTKEETVIRLPSVKGRWMYLNIKGSKDLIISSVAVHGMVKAPK